MRNEELPIQTQFDNEELLKYMNTVHRSTSYDKIVRWIDKSDLPYKAGNSTARPQVRTTMD